MRLGRGTAYDLAWKPGGDILVVSGGLGVWFYDYAFNEVGHLETTTGIKSIAWNADGTQLATGSQDGLLQIWAVSSSRTDISVEPLASVKFTTSTDIDKDYVGAVEWSASGTYVAGISRNEVIVLNVDIGGQQSLFADSDKVTSFQPGAISWHPHDDTLGFATKNGTFVWDITTDQQLHRLPASQVVKWLSPDTLLITFADTFQVFDLDLEQVVRTIVPAFNLDQLSGLSVYDHILATTDIYSQEITLTNLMTGGELASLLAQTDHLFSITWSPSGVKMAALTQSQSDILVWDTASGILQNEYKQHNQGYRKIRLSPDGSRILAQDWDTADIWDIASQTRIAHLSDLHGFAADWSPDSTRIATSNNNELLVIWDAATGEQLSTHQGQLLDIMVLENTDELAWLDANTIVTAGGAFLLWDLTSNQLPQIADCHPWADIHFWWSPDRSYVAVMAWDSTQVWICDRQFERILSVEGYRDIAWSPDNNEIATVGIGNTLRIWDTTNSEVKVTARDNDDILVIAGSPDWREIATVHSNDKLQIWERMTSAYLKPAAYTYIDGLEDVLWTENGLITVSNKGIIQIWLVNYDR